MKETDNNINNNPPSSIETKESLSENKEPQQPVPIIPEKTEMCQLIYYDFSVK